MSERTNSSPTAPSPSPFPLRTRVSHESNLIFYSINKWMEYFIKFGLNERAKRASVRPESPIAFHRLQIAYDFFFSLLSLSLSTCSTFSSIYIYEISKWKILSWKRKKRTSGNGEIWNGYWVRSLFLSMPADIYMYNNFRVKNTFSSRANTRLMMKWIQCEQTVKFFNFKRTQRGAFGQILLISLYFASFFLFSLAFALCGSVD